MEHITDHSQSLDLNPRQIYIVIRKHNRRYLKTFESIARASQRDDIRFCIIDTTAFEEHPSQISDLYLQFLNEEGDTPWDFIVRDYPENKSDYRFSCHHILHHNATDIRAQLEDLKEDQERDIWRSITRIFREKLILSTAAIAKRRAFYDTLEVIQRSRGCTEEACRRNIGELESFFGTRHRSPQQETAVRTFIADQIHIMDTFMNVTTPREISDRYMQTFMETGGTISRPGLRIVRSPQAKKGIHARFSLEITTGYGETFLPEFKMLAAFAFYVLSMREAGIHIRKTDFDPAQGSRYCKHYCMELAAIIATLGENLFTHKGDTLLEAERKCMEFHEKMLRDEKFWQNVTFRCDEAIKKALGEKGSPFLLRPLGVGSKPERWLEIPEDYIDLSDPEFSEAYRKNFEHIRNRGLFSHLDREEKNSVSAQKDLSSAEESPIFTAEIKDKTAVKMNKFVKNDDRITCMGSGQYNFDRIMVREYPEGFETGRRNPFKDRIHTEEVGGTCGNVMCMLSFWGWCALPQAQFDMSREGYQMKKDFKRYGCDISFVENIPEGGTSLLDCIHRRNRDTGEHELGRKGYGPNGSMHPKRKQLRARDEVPQVLERMQDVPDVYFFDSNEAGPRALAEGLRHRGSMIYYESEGFDTENEFHRCVEVADIVKFSVEHIQDHSICDRYRDKLFIQTLGGDGLRFRLRDGEWIHLDAEPVREVVDWEGCGDTTTATFLYMLGNMGRLDVSSLEESSVRTVLETAIRMAAKCTQYYGSKGWIHASKSFEPQPDDVGSPYDDPMVIAAFEQQNEEDHTGVTSLEKIPEKDYREYDIKGSMIYYSGGEMLKGREQKIRRGDCSVLSNFYTCQLHYDGREFTSAEQVYHYYRFRETPLIQELIMQCRTGSQVKAACGGFTFRPKNHQVTRWRYMTLAMELKYLQCKEFRQKLQSLGDTPLVESTPGFDFFGSTVPGTHKKVGGVLNGHDVRDKYIGMNGCGRCMMAVRDKFRGWTEAQLRAYTPSSNLEEWWNSSPVYLEQLEGMGI